jgi:hypothetical protein
MYTRAGPTRPITPWGCVQARRDTRLHDVNPVLLYQALGEQGGLPGKRLGGQARAEQAQLEVPEFGVYA